MITCPDYVELTINAQVTLPKSAQLIHVRTTTQLKQCGRQLRLIITANNKQQAIQDQGLIHYLAKAYQWRNQITAGKVQSIQDIATAEGVDSTHVTRTINKAFLAPDIIRAILNGTQPPHLTLKFLKQFRVLPNNWDDQKALLKFNQ